MPGIAKLPWRRIPLSSFKYSELKNEIERPAYLFAGSTIFADILLKASFCPLSSTLMSPRMSASEID